MSQSQEAAGDFPTPQGLDLGQSVDDLAMACQMFAEGNAAYRDVRTTTYRRQVELGRESDETSWTASLHARHSLGDSAYDGHEFTLTLECQISPNVVPDELKHEADRQEMELPPDDTVYGVQVVYEAKYTINRYNTLGWNILRKHTLHFDTPAPEISDEVAQEEGYDPADDETEAVVPDELPIEEALDNYEPPRDKDEVEVEHEDPFVRFTHEQRLEAARRIFGMVVREEVPDFDLSTMFPRGALLDLVDYEYLFDSQ